jgi:hypothetical protein
MTIEASMTKKTPKRPITIPVARRSLLTRLDRALAKRGQALRSNRLVITERDARRSPHELLMEKLAGSGASAIRALMRAGIHVVAQKPLVEFLRFKPKREIIRMPQEASASFRPGSRRVVRGRVR